MEKVYRGKKDPKIHAIYRIVVNKLRTGNIMSTVKKTHGSIVWQEIVDEIIKSIFLEDNEVIMRDRLPISEKSAVELDKMKRYIKTLKQNKSLEVQMESRPKYIKESLI